MFKVGDYFKDEFKNRLQARFGTLVTVVKNGEHFFLLSL